MQGVVRGHGQGLAELKRHVSGHDDGGNGCGGRGRRGAGKVVIVVIVVVDELGSSHGLTTLDQDIDWVDRAMCR